MRHVMIGVLASILLSCCGGRSDVYGPTEEPDTTPVTLPEVDVVPPVTLSCASPQKLFIGERILLSAPGCQGLPQKEAWGFDLGDFALQASPDSLQCDLVMTGCDIVGKCEHGVDKSLKMAYYLELKGGGTSVQGLQVASWGSCPAAVWQVEGQAP